MYRPIPSFVAAVSIPGTRRAASAQPRRVARHHDERHPENARDSRREAHLARLLAVDPKPVDPAGDRVLHDPADGARHRVVPHEHRRPERAVDPLHHPVRPRAVPAHQLDPRLQIVDQQVLRVAVAVLDDDPPRTRPPRPAHRRVHVVRHHPPREGVVERLPVRAAALRPGDESRNAFDVRADEEVHAEDYDRRRRTIAGLKSALRAGETPPQPPEGGGVFPAGGFAGVSFFGLSASKSIPFPFGLFIQRYSVSSV